MKLTRRKFVKTGLIYVPGVSVIGSTFIVPGPGAKHSLFVSGAPTLPITANLLAWWYADSLSLSDGTGVSSWTDSSGNGYTGTQATAGQQPIFKTNIFGTAPALLFPGVGPGRTFLGINAIAPSGDFTILAVTKNITVDAIIMGGPSALSDQIRIGQGGLNILSVFEGGSFDNPLSSALATPKTDPRLNVFGRSGSSAKFYENNGSDVSAGTLGSGDVISLTQIGAGANSAINDFAGYIAEIVIYTSILSQSNVQTMYSYFKPRWGLP